MANDYGLIGGIGQGLQQGLLAYQRQKQLNRENQIQNLTSGLEEDENGNLKLNDQAQQHKQVQSLKDKGDVESYDPNSQKSINTRNVARGLLAKSSPGSEKAISDDMSASELNSENGLLSKAIAGGYGMQGAQARVFNNPMAEVREQGLQFQKHKTAVDAIQNDKSTQQMLTSVQNLQNAKSNFDKGGATPQDFAELQQAVRANLGIKGQSGVGERQESYLRSLGLSATKMNQFLTGEPKSVLDSDPAFAEQVKGLADLEIKNKKAQAAQQIGKKAKSFSSIYQDPKMAGYAGDFKNTLADQYSQFGLDENGKPIPEQAGGAAAGGYTDDVINYAKSHGISNDQALAIKNQRTQGAQPSEKTGGIMGSIKRGLIGG